MTVDQRPFSRSVAVVAVGHVGLLLVLLILPAFKNLFPRQAEPVIPIDFVVDIRTEKGEDGMDEPAPPAPKPPIPAPKQKPEPPKPSPPKPDPAKPKDKPLAAPTPPKSTAARPQVQVSGVKVQRKSGSPTPLTPEEIRRRLELGARAGFHNSAIPTEEGRNFNLIYQALYKAWLQPNKEVVGNATVTARLRLDRSGRIITAAIERPSGVPDLDRSVQAALNAVDRVDGLSVSFLESHASLTVLFEVE